MENQEIKPTSNFDRMREQIWGAPGFDHKRATVDWPGSAFIPMGSWIIETLRSDEGNVVFIQYIGADGATRLVLPNKVTDAIYRQRDGLISRSRSRGAKKAIEKRIKRGDKFFEKKPAPSV